MKFNQVAADLQHQAVQDGYARIRLPRGLALSLSIKEEGQRVLAAGRPDAYPSPDELDTVTRAFGVPVSTDPAKHNIGGWKVITWRWIEHEPAHQPDLLPAQPVYP